MQQCIRIETVICFGRNMRRRDRIDAVLPAACGLGNPALDPMLLCIHTDLARRKIVPWVGGCPPSHSPVSEHNPDWATLSWTIRGGWGRARGTSNDAVPHICLRKTGVVAGWQVGHDVLLLGEVLGRRSVSLIMPVVVPPPRLPLRMPVPAVLPYPSFGLFPDAVLREVRRVPSGTGTVLSQSMWP